MRCQDVEHALAASAASREKNIMQSVRAHMDECESCRDLARVLELPSREAQMDPIQIERLQKMLVADLRPVRPLLPTWVFVLAFAVIFVAFVLLGVWYLGAYGWFVLLPEQKVAVFATLAASAALLAFSLARQMVPGQRSLCRPGLLPVGLFVLLCLVITSVFQARTDPHFIASGERCLRAGLPYAIPAGLVFWLILRRGAILSSRVAGAIAGMLAGLVSTTVLEVHCPNTNMWHILVWHGGFALLGMLSGLLVAISGETIRARVS